MRRQWLTRYALRLLTCGAFALAAACVGAGAVRAASSVPRIDERHIFEGAVNKQGRLVGFHHVGAHRDRIIRIVRGPTALGVYEAEIRAFGLTKRSTFFPDAWTREQVLAAIREAYLNPIERSEGKIIGKTAGGVRIQMYLDRAGNIATAFPLLEERPIR